MKNKKTVLVLTNSVDGAHTDSVIGKLQNKGQKVFRFDSDKLQNGELAIKFHLNGFRFCYQNSIIESDEIKSVWYRRPNHLAIDISDPIQKKFAEEEIKYALEGIWLSMSKVFWLSNLDSIERARKKLFQLSLANQIGFMVPRTLVTNNPKEVKVFFESCRGNMIFKTIKQGFLDYGDKGFNIPTTLISEKHLNHLQLVKCPPCLFQERIDKAYELRVTLVGNKAFTVRIDSQSHLETSLDWRNPTLLEKLNYSTVTLPKDILELCKKMMWKLDLKFGAFDLAVDRNGKFVFFEVNPNGQWYWLEKYVGICVSDAIADILSIGENQS